jgi:hypothetical protein
VKFDLSKPYLTQAEAQEFKRLRDVGAVSFYRTEKCKACGSEVPKGKSYCKKEEYDSRLESLRVIREAAQEIMDNRWQEKIESKKAGKKKVKRWPKPKK